MIKKLIKIISIGILIILVIFILVSRLMSHHYEYFIGKDSHEAFGNGEYQIMTVSHTNDVKEYSLYNMKYKETIIDHLQSYKKNDNYVYFYGTGVSEIYVLLNTDDNKITYYGTSDAGNLICYNQMIEDNAIQVIDSFEKFDDKDKEQFEMLISECQGEGYLDNLK